MADVKLNLGAGTMAEVNAALEAQGYQNLDIKTGQPGYPLPDVATDSVDEVRASHLLEHFSEAEAPKVVDEWVRVLKRGGLLRIAVPDFEWVAREYFRTERMAEGKVELTQALFRAFIVGGQVDEYDSHKSAWTPAKLRQLMESAGLEGIETWTSSVQDCAALPVSLNLQGHKRAAPIVTGAKVAAVMSIPRLLFSANMACAMASFAPLGIPVFMHTGVFWGQMLTKSLRKALEVGAELVFTVDYDTVFTREDVQYMIATMGAHPEFDALVGAQMKRGKAAPLITMRDANGKCRDTVPLAEVSQEFVPCASGHFGLTAFRAARLKDLPHPWFLAVPGKDGLWEEGRLDEDIYFWEQWRKSGRTLFLANKVRLGHLEEGITWPSAAFTAIFQNMADYREDGMPKEAIWQSGS
jgi:predicted SAM-dependent methyltransferase